MRTVIVMLLVAAAFVGDAAACDQCPSSPCNIAACPPAEANIFAEILIDGQETGIGGVVNNEEMGGDLSVTGVTYNADGTVTLDMEGELAEGVSIYTQYSRYEKINGVWVLQSTTDLEPSIAMSMMSGGECAMNYGNCRIEEGVCDQTVGTCHKSSWCSDSTGDYCLTAYGICLTPTSGGCECTVYSSPSCLGPLAPTLPDVRRWACPDPSASPYHKKCQLKIVRVAEG